MSIRWYSVGLGVLLASTACASDGADGNRDAQSFSQLQQKELEEERQSFIANSRERLRELDREINRMDARLEHEAEFVDAEKRADWSQELFELKQDRSRLEERLERAQTASPEEWRSMRGNLGVALDSLEAGVRRIGNAVSSAFERDSDAPHGARLCELSLQDTEVEVRRSGDQLVVEMTTRDDGAVENLRRQARELPTDPESWSAGEASTSASEDDRIDVQEPVEVRDIDRGVRLVFVPRAGDVESVQSRLEEQARRLESGRC